VNHTIGCPLFDSSENSGGDRGGAVHRAQRLGARCRAATSRSARRSRRATRTICSGSAAGWSKAYAAQGRVIVGARAAAPDVARSCAPLSRATAKTGRAPDPTKKSELAAGRRAVLEPGGAGILSVRRDHHGGAVRRARAGASPRAAAPARLFDLGADMAGAEPVRSKPGEFRGHIYDSILETIGATPRAHRQVRGRWRLPRRPPRKCEFSTRRIR